MSSYRIEYKTRRQKERIRRRKIFLVFFVIICAAVVFFARNYLYISKPIIQTADGNDVSLYIPTNADYQYVKDELISLNVLKSKNAFNWLAKKSHYDENVHPGRYI